MSRPPASTSDRTTCAAARRVRSSSSSSTLAVPTPTGGTRSPVLGIARMMSGASLLCAKAGRANNGRSQAR